ncbi:trans-aconitate 2-methyltransferase [Bartonella apis]|uniref:Trans-aconitate 2-methyltransferase n=1 Tax=Bartonella apis TaxID=1686310 RepID=A0A1R0F9M6_9HYPH|nr:trans-aconitate 2-methyltransferase [Bartonella apis]MCT6824859.1 trans-aconitate 2-methyltransferase [Bartonella apis]MCT6861444.1 trans-aconitate 2-methyltransferase [Bartonella apis]MCT6887463.1 trans-aconitate 2-methyltransferase [Bartonella apis]OLY43660.1 trans-aconitate 2-methyltransferase [Bartonella apis]OLY47636.1 trans-aconitate 2-methyltransferase [Bartonella apis]
MQDWSAQDYLKFEDERLRPVHDLANAVPLKEVKTIVDLGCGPGTSTEVLCEHWPRAKVSGFDSSAEMIASAKKRLPKIEFTVQDIEKWSPDSDVDLLFSNAVFQWLPDHIDEMKRLVSAMKSGAALAVQMPDNLFEPLHRAMIHVAEDKRWNDRIGAVAREKLPNVSVYYDALKPLVRYIDIWQTIYNPIMENHEAIVDWVKGAALRPFLAPLNDEEKQDYLALYLERIKKLYPTQYDGKVLLRFPRMFLVLVK